MRVAVFGASGGIGRLVVERLLADGHQVAALVRAPAKLTIDHPRLTIRTGQLSDAAAVRDVVAGSDAVISALGPSLKRGAQGSPVTDGTRAISPPCERPACGDSSAWRPRASPTLVTGRRTGRGFCR